jgi:hypothetical protein
VSPTPEARRTEHEASFGAVRDGVAVLGPDWRIRYMNASMLEILRLIGGTTHVETLWDALPRWERSDAADTLRHAMDTGAAVCFRVDGERGRGRVWEVHAEPLESGDLRVRLRNVTVQAQVEEAERRLRDDLPLGEFLETLAHDLGACLAGLDRYVRPVEGNGLANDARPETQGRLRELRRDFAELIDRVRDLAQEETGTRG